MGYPLQRSMRTPVITMPDGEMIAFGIADDGMTWNFGLFRNQGGEWLAVPPLINDNLSSAEIMGAGSVAEYLKKQLPKMQERVRQYLQVKKPDQSDKVACLGYDLAMDVEFDPITLEFSLNKEPPLSHAR